MGLVSRHDVVTSTYLQLYAGTTSKKHKASGCVDDHGHVTTIYASPAFSYAPRHQRPQPAPKRSPYTRIIITTWFIRKTQTIIRVDAQRDKMHTHVHRRTSPPSLDGDVCFFCLIVGSNEQSAPVRTRLRRSIHFTPPVRLSLSSSGDEDPAVPVSPHVRLMSSTSIIIPSPLPFFELKCGLKSRLSSAIVYPFFTCLLLRSYARQD